MQNIKYCKFSAVYESLCMLQRLQQQLELKRPLVEQGLEAGKFYLREEGEDLHHDSGAESAGEFSNCQPYSLRCSCGSSTRFYTTLFLCSETGHCCKLVCVSRTAFIRGLPLCSLNLSYYKHTDYLGQTASISIFIYLFIYLYINKEGGIEWALLVSLWL